MNISDGDGEQQNAAQRYIAETGSIPVTQGTGQA